MGKVGRPKKYKEEFVEQVEKLCIVFGADDKKLAEYFGVDKDTINRWKHNYPEFYDSIKRGKDIYDNKNVEISLLERALGYEHEDTVYFSYKGEIISEKTTKHYPPDVTAAIFWLKNRHPDRWKDVKKTEVSGPGGKPIETRQTNIIEIDPSEWSEEELDVLEKIALKQEEKFGKI